MSRFDQLLEGYLHNSLTESQWEEFLDLVKDNPDAPLIREHHFDASHTGHTSAEQRQRMLANIWSGAQTEKKQRVIPIWRWSAAAAVLILALSSSLFLLHHKEQPARTIAKYKNDVAPGKTGATLQLADGSTITLDSTTTGLIARQGNSRVVRQANGALAYQSTPENNNTEQNEQYNKVSTGKGRQFHVILPDGTKVWLNSSSSINYPTSFTGPDRPVETTGEVYFEVTRNPSKPFIVKTAGQNITVLGTNFNVNTYDDEPVKRTTLLQGSVRVSGAGQNVLLIPGQEAAIDHNGDRLKVAAVNADAAVAWKNGFFQFDNADLPTVMRQLARWYDVEVKYEGHLPGWSDFKGQIGRDLTLAQVLKILEQTRVHFRIEEDRRIVIFP